MNEVFRLNIRLKIISHVQILREAEKSQKMKTLYFLEYFLSFVTAESVMTDVQCFTYARCKNTLVKTQKHLRIFPCYGT